MKKNLIRVLSGFVIAFFFISCSQTNNNISQVTIDLGLSNNNKSVTKAPALSGLSGNVTLLVTGPGMNPISAVIPPDTGALSLGVPAGPNRLFEVRAVTGDSIDTSTGYNGKNYAYLAPGANKTISIRMERVTFSVMRSENGKNLIPTSLAIDSNAVYVSGYDSDDGDYWQTERRDINTGELDRGFNGTGIVKQGSYSSNGTNSIAVDDTSLYLAGDLGSYLTIEKRNKLTGSLDPSFNDSVVFPGSSDDYLFSITYDSGYLYSGGYEDKGDSMYSWMIGKNDIDTGDYVNEFGNSGSIIIDLYNGSSSTESVYSIAVDSQYLYTAGDDYSTGEGRWRIEKRDKAAGDLIPGFGDNGVQISNPSTSSDSLKDIAINSDYIFAAGYDYDGGDMRARIEKRSITTGALITAFGNNGVATYNPSSLVEWINSTAIDENYIYSAGYQALPGNGLGQWIILKHNINTGNLDSNFGNNGVLTVDADPDFGEDRAMSIEVDDNYIYIAGSVYNKDVPIQWCVQKRDKRDGNF
jgi:hypothetical protein